MTVETVRRLQERIDALADRVTALEKRLQPVSEAGRMLDAMDAVRKVEPAATAMIEEAGWTFDQCKWSQKKQDDQPAPMAAGWTAAGGTWGRELPLQAAWHWVESERDGSHSVVYLDPANCSVRNFKRWARIPYPD